MQTAVLLINLGTPDAPTTPKVRKYLTQFLNDKRVIDINAAGRFVLVNGIIVPFRSSKSAKLYQHIWKKEGSPLLLHSLDLQKKVQVKLGADYHVELAMRYQSPSIKNALENIQLKRPKKIIVLPLYPQYASSSTGSTIEEVMEQIKGWEVFPDVTIKSAFYNNQKFIDACVEQGSKFNIDEYDHVLFSYHGLPERHIKKGSVHYGADSCKLGSCCETITDKNQLCYRANCFYTTQQIATALKIDKSKYTIAFQSRLDDKWVKPYSDKVIVEKAKAGVKKILAFSPAFVADCLETIHEIGTEYDELFKENGGEKVDLVPSLNSSDKWVEAIEDMILNG